MIGCGWGSGRRESAQENRVRDRRRRRVREGRRRMGVMYEFELWD